MARPAIPEENYQQALQKMVNEGKHLETITAAQLQGVVGGRYSRADSMLESFKAASQKAVEASIEDKPDWYSDQFEKSLLGGIKKLTDDLWGVINDERKRKAEQSEQQVELYRQDMEAKQTEHREQINKLEDLIESLSDDLAKVRDQLASEKALREKAEEGQLMLEQKLDEERQNCSDMKAGNEQKQARIQELQAEIVEHHSEQKQLANDLSIIQQNKSALEGQLSTLRNQSEKTEQQLSNTQNKLEIEQQTSAGLKADNDQYQTRLGEQKALLDAGQARLDKMVSENSALQQENGSLDGQLKALEKEREHDQSELSRLQDELKSERAMIAGTIAKVTSSNNSKDDDKNQGKLI